MGPLWFDIAVAQYIIALIRSFFLVHSRLRSQVGRRAIRQHIRVGVVSFIAVFAISNLHNEHAVDEAVRISFILMVIDTIWREDGGLAL